MIKDRYRATILLIFIIMLLLSLFNIDNRYMFVDEAAEAMLGENFLRFKLPKAWDGNNLIMAGVNGNEFNDSLIFVRKNWLTSAVTAAVQGLTGPLKLNRQSQVGAMRTAFVLFGFLGAVLYYFLVKKISKDRGITLLALLLFAFSVPLYLYIRSIYYLAPTLAFSLAVLLFYLEYIDHKRRRDLRLFVLSSVLLFHCFYPYFIIMMTTIGVTYLIYDRRKLRPKAMIFPGIIITALTLPWYVYARSFLSKVEKSPIVSFEVFLKYLLGYLWQIHAYFFPFIPLLLLALLVRFTNPHRSKSKDKVSVREKSRSCLLLTLPIGLTLFMMSITNTFLDTRRLITAIPFLYILLAYLSHYIYRSMKHLAYAVILLCLFTNVFHILPYYSFKLLKINPGSIEAVVKPPVPYFDVDEGWNSKIMDLEEYLSQACRFESYFMNYLEEIANDYDDADEGMILFLQKYSRKGQKVHMIGYQFETIAYYTGLRVVNRLDPKGDPLPSAFHSYPNAVNYEHLTKCPISECDWIIERRLGNTLQNVPWHNEQLFERIEIDFPDSAPWNELWAHSFVTDRSYPGISIYRNRQTTEPLYLGSNILKKDDLLD